MTYLEADREARRLTAAGTIHHAKPADREDSDGLCWREWVIAPGPCPPMPTGGDPNNLLREQDRLFGYDHVAFLRRQYR